MSEITSRPATQEYRDGWERTFRCSRRGPDFAGYARAAKALMAVEVARSNREIVGELRRLRALYRIPDDGYLQPVEPEHVEP